MKTILNLHGLPIEVNFEYHPSEKKERYDKNLEGYSGIDDFVSVKDVYHCNSNINTFINEMDWWQLIEEMILEKIRKNNEK